MVVGKLYMDKAFLSTSLNGFDDKRMINYRDRNVKMTIKKSHSGRNVEAFGKKLYSNEREVLFPPKTEFLVTSVSCVVNSEGTAHYYVTLEEKTKDLGFELKQYTLQHRKDPNENNLYVLNGLKEKVQILPNRYVGDVYCTANAEDADDPLSCCAHLKKKARVEFDNNYCLIASTKKLESSKATIRFTIKCRTGRILEGSPYGEIVEGDNLHIKMEESVFSRPLPKK